MAVGISKTMRMRQYFQRVKHRQAVWLTRQSRAPFWVVAPCALAVGLATFSLIMANHDLKIARTILIQRIQHHPVQAIGDRRWWGPDQASIAVGIVLFSLIWLGPLWLACSRSRDNYHGLRRLALAMLILVGTALLTLLVAFVVVRMHARYPEQAWLWPSYRAIGLSWPAIIWALGFLMELRWVRGEYLRVRPPYCHRCKYDLRGSIPAGRVECPECGEPIPAGVVLHFKIWLQAAQE